MFLRDEANEPGHEHLESKRKYAHGPPACRGGALQELAVLRPNEPLLPLLVELDPWVVAFISDRRRQHRHADAMCDSAGRKTSKRLTPVRFLLRRDFGLHEQLHDSSLVFRRHERGVRRRARPLAADYYPRISHPRTSFRGWGPRVARNLAEVTTARL